MQLLTYFGLGLIVITFIMQQWNYVGLGITIIGVSLCIPEIVIRIKKKKLSK